MDPGRDPLNRPGDQQDQAPANHQEGDDRDDPLRPIDCRRRAVTAEQWLPGWLADRKREPQVPWPRGGHLDQATLFVGQALQAPAEDYPAVGRDSHGLRHSQTITSSAAHKDPPAWSNALRESVVLVSVRGVRPVPLTHHEVSLEDSSIESGKGASSCPSGRRPAGRTWQLLQS